MSLTDTDAQPTDPEDGIDTTADAAFEPSDDAIHAEYLAADRAQRTRHLGELRAVLPPALIDLVAAADRYVEAEDAADPFDFNRDTDAEYDALVAAVKRLRQEPMRLAATAWTRGAGTHAGEDRSFVFDAEGRIVATLNAVHPDYEANARRIVGAGAVDPVKAQLLAACEGLLKTGLKGGADYRLICIGMSGRELQPEDDAKAERIEEAVCAARAAVAAARGEVSNG